MTESFDLFAKEEEKKSPSAMELYQVAAEKKKIKEVTGDWLIADGIEIKLGNGEKSNIDVNWDGNMAIGRLEQVGTYDSNNNVLAFVDGKGQLRIAPTTSERVQKLEDAGYKKGSISVPLSNGELPTDEKVREQWQKILDETPKDK